MDVCVETTAGDFAKVSLSAPGIGIWCKLKTALSLSPPLPPSLFGFIHKRARLKEPAGPKQVPRFVDARAGWQVARGCHDPAKQNRLEHPAPHEDFSGLHEKMSGKGESASEAHSLAGHSPACT